MTAQVFPIKPQSVNALVEQTKAAWDRADKHTADASSWQLRTGQLLVELKQRVKDEGGKWLEVVKKLGRSERRARELMELAKGGTTVEQQRNRKRKSVKSSRAKKKSALRSADKRVVLDTVDDDPNGTEGYAEPDNLEERWQYSLANLCGDIIAREASWQRNFPEWRNYECPSHIKTLTKEAVTALTSIVKTIGK